jgi:hypothetical protein
MRPRGGAWDGALLQSLCVVAAAATAAVCVSDIARLAVVVLPEVGAQLHRNPVLLEDEGVRLGPFVLVLHVLSHCPMAVTSGRVWHGVPAHWPSHIMCEGQCATPGRWGLDGSSAARSCACWPESM